MRKSFLSFSAFFISIVVSTLLLSCKKEMVKPLSLENLKIMSLNVWSGLDYIGTFKMGEYEPVDVREKRYKALLEEIAAVSPDVIGINEANFLPDYVERLAKDINYDYIYHVGISGVRISRVGLPWNLREGDALLVRKGLFLEEVGRKQLSGGFVYNQASFHLEDATQVLVGKINTNGKNIYIAVTHLHSSPPDIKEYREKMNEYKERYDYSDKEYKIGLAEVLVNTKWRIDEAKLLLSYLKSVVPSGAPLILMGDFNSEIGWPAMDVIMDGGFKDTFQQRENKQQYTWDNKLNDNIKKYYPYDLNKKYDSLYGHMDKYLTLSRLRIDFILINQNIFIESVTQSGVCGNKKYFDVHPSDHFGVYSQINLNKGI